MPVDKDGKLFSNKVQVLRPITLPPGMEVQVHCRPVGLIENGIQETGDWSLSPWFVSPERRDRQSSDALM